MLKPIVTLVKRRGGRWAQAHRNYQTGWGDVMGAIQGRYPDPESGEGYALYSDTRRRWSIIRRAAGDVWCRYHSEWYGAGQASAWPSKPGDWQRSGNVNKPWWAT